jgi:uncharacterized membrane protein (UPF0127 family)
MKTLFTALLFATTALFPFSQVRANEVLKTEHLRLGSQKIVVEIANSDASREHGLMFRKHLGRNRGMLFVFNDERPLNFWMKNTLIPLSIGYFDREKRLVKTLEMVPAVMGVIEPPVYSSEKPALYALEMEKDWFPKNRIKLGTRFEFVH